MRRRLSAILTLCIMVTSIVIPTPTLAATNEEIRVKLNQDMKQVYDEVGYYPEEDFNVYYKNQIRGGGQAWSNIPAYGSPSGDWDKEEREYLGKDALGRDDVPNPQYGWVAGWSGVRIYEWGVKEPWKYGYCTKGDYDYDAMFEIPNVGFATLEDLIQLGIDTVYGNKTYGKVKADKSNISLSRLNEKVHIPGEKPEDGWMSYVHVIIPPTDQTWGQGRLYRPNGHYMGIPIAPFSLLGPNLKTTLTCVQADSVGVRNDTVVKASAEVKSTFDKEVETTYKWVVKGNTTGNYYHTETTTRFDGYGKDASSGTTTIPSKGSPVKAVFDIEFVMPEEPVIITFEINPNKNPEESTYADNVDSKSVPWIRYDIANVNYTLDYDELTKEIAHNLAGGGISASVNSPSESGWRWDDSEMTGDLKVDIKDEKGALTGAKVQEGSNPKVNEKSTSVSRSPIIEGIIQRTDYGDFYLNNFSNPIRDMIVSYEGDVERPYKYHYSHEVYCCTEEDGSSHYTTCSYCEGYYSTGTVNGIFQPGEDRISIKTLVYNGIESMPSVAARNFKKQIDNNAHNSLKKTIWWESEEYPMLVQRWMKNVYASGDEDYEAIEGQYERIFSQQNTATVEWKVDQSMSSIYQEDLNSAQRKSTNKLDYPHVPFATDRDLQRKYQYPFKSGYYFNPAGVYILTIRTEIFKDEAQETEEHKALVDEVLQSFKYGSNMTYMMDGSQGQLRLGIDDPEAMITDDGLIGIERAYNYITEYEVEYSPSSSGFTHTYFKEILEGYSESNTEKSKNDYKYREYIQDGQYICKIVEETVVKLTVNPDNKKCFTFGGMKNGKYYMTAWLEDIDVSDITNVPNMKLLGVNTEVQFDQIEIGVHGSMYDDLNN